jgi:hypothetical protein
MCVQPPPAHSNHGNHGHSRAIANSLPPPELLKALPFTAPQFMGVLPFGLPTHAPSMPQIMANGSDGRSHTPPTGSIKREPMSSPIMDKVSQQMNHSSIAELPSPFYANYYIFKQKFHHFNPK